MKNKYWLIAGILTIITFFAHLVGGQMDLVNPMLDSNLSDQAKTEWLGAWHMISFVLLGTAMIYMKKGFNDQGEKDHEIIAFISYLFITFAISFILANVYQFVFSPQAIVLLPIGLLGLFGVKKSAMLG